jgi:hypothetical protein
VVGPQRTDHRQADLLGHVVRRTQHRLLASQPGPAVPQDERVDQRQQFISGPAVAADRGGDQPAWQIPAGAPTADAVRPVFHAGAATITGLERVDRATRRRNRVRLRELDARD